MVRNLSTAKQPLPYFLCYLALTMPSHFSIILGHLIVLCLGAMQLQAQHFLNGSFEMNDYECAYNLANADFDNHVPFVAALGNKSEMDVMTDTCGYGLAYEGRDFVALYGGFYSDAIALELDSPMIPGREYVLEFANKNGLGTGQGVGRLVIGFSVEKGLGNQQYKSTFAGLDWTTQQLTFTADAPYRFVGIHPDGDGWIFVDDFRFGCPALELGDDTVLCQVAGTILSVNPSFDSYQWSTGDVGPSTTADGPGLYIVEAFYDDCIVSDCILLSELDYPCDCKVYEPNAFSPNGDGINDDFGPASPCPFTKFELLVFDRWGQMVFHTDEPGKAWDGQIGDKAGMAGVYAYILRFRFPNSENVEINKGEVLLLR